MIIPNDPGLPMPNSPSYLENLRFKLNKILRQIAIQTNSLTDGKLVAITNASTAEPTTGKYSQGDFIRNSAPTELGTALSKYIIYGWICVADGEPGTWKQCRFLTGN
jgi:hypothetical protein